MSLKDNRHKPMPWDQWLAHCQFDHLNKLNSQSCKDHPHCQREGVFLSQCSLALKISCRKVPHQDDALLSSLQQHLLIVLQLENKKTFVNQERSLSYQERQHCKLELPFIFHLGGKLIVLSRMQGATPQSYEKSEWESSFILGESQGY